MESAAHPKVPGPLACGGMHGDTPTGPRRRVNQLDERFLLRASADMAASLLTGGGWGERRRGEMCVREREREKERELLCLPVRWGKQTREEV